MGLNPAPRSVAAGHYYQGRLGRRLWKRLVDIGLLTDAVPGAEDDAFVAAGHGLTDLVKRPTASAHDLERDELQRGAQQLRTNVRTWQPGLILFVFKEAAHLALGSPVSPGTGSLLEGIPTFLLSGPYAARNEADRVNAELREVLSMEISNVPQSVTSQRVTEADIEAGIIRLPRIAKPLLPSQKSEVAITLRGTPLTASYDPKRGPDRERSAVLRIRKSPPVASRKAGRAIARVEGFERSGATRLREQSRVRRWDDGAHLRDCGRRDGLRHARGSEAACEARDIRALGTAVANRVGRPAAIRAGRRRCYDYSLT